MVLAVGKVILSAIIISFASWLANKKPGLAGFIIALPLSTLLVLMLNHAQFNDTEKSVQFAQSIFISIPLSLFFFVPFLMAKKLQFGFWGLYSSGIVLLGVAFLCHRFLIQRFF